MSMRAWVERQRAKLSPDERAKFDARVMEIDARYKAGEDINDLRREYEARYKAERAAEVAS